MALIRFPATGDKIGSLIVNPVARGVRHRGRRKHPRHAARDVRQRFDLVGFDPRGSAPPHRHCGAIPDADNDRLRADPQVDYSPEGVEHIEGQTKEFVQRCIDKMGTDFLANIGTASVAKDLDQLRAAVGDDKLNYIGYSYGTRIGAEYAEEFPDKVRAMILDGAVDPNADPIQADIDQAEAFQKAFNDFAADCAKESDCPLGNDPAKAVDVYHSLVDPLVDDPIRTRDPRGLGYSDALVGTIMALYSPNLWRHLTRGLTEMTRGAATPCWRWPTCTCGVTRRALHQCHRCAGRGELCRPAAGVRPGQGDRGRSPDARSRSVHELREFTGHAPLSTCAFWPVPPTSTPHLAKAPACRPCW